VVAVSFIIARLADNGRTFCGRFSFKT